jgi:hypothetical protein
MRKSFIFAVLALLVAGLSLSTAAEELRADNREETDVLSYGAILAVSPPILQHVSSARRTVQRPLAMGAAAVLATRHVDTDVAPPRAPEKSRTDPAAWCVLRC